MRIFLFLSITIVFFAGSAFSVFQPYPSLMDYETGQYPTDTVCKDFNRDGTPDFATTCYLDDLVTVHLSRPGGTYVVLQETPMWVYAPHEIIAGDFNNDSWPDLVVRESCGYYYCGTKLRIFLNQGQGLFGYGIDLKLGERPAGLSVYDLTKDGLDDLFVTTESELRVYRCLGEGQFELQWSHPLRRYVKSIEMADFNRDGLMDFAGCSFNGPVTVFINRGNEGFDISEVSPVIEILSS